MAGLGSDSWLEQELAELDEAEQFIQQTMSNFVPSRGVAKTKVDAERKQNDGASSRQAQQVVRSMPPKGQNDVDKLTQQLIEGLDTGKGKDSGHYDNFSLPPPPDLDDLIISQQETKTSDLPPPPPPLITNVAPPPTKKNPPVMSKTAPPPVLPKPSRSTALEPKKSSVTIQLNRPSSHHTTQPAVQPMAPRENDPPPPIVKFAHPVQSMPKDIKKNSEEELDFLTNNLLSNMDNPKDEDFYGYCEKCNGIVEGEKVGCKALDGVFHISCFLCATCSRPLHGEPFYGVGKNAYCESCYISSLEKCSVCLQTITDKILRATGKPYHPACFKCVECGKSLDGIPFTLDDESKIYCVEDYHQKFAPRCSVCHYPILPEPGKEETVRIIALDRSFHVTCYKCEQCQVQLSSEQGCFPLDDHIYCRDCNTIMVQQLTA